MNMIEDLKAVIGKDVSENRSPTLRAKLIKVNKTTCIFEVVQSPYREGDESKIGMKYKVPISYSWNAFFFQERFGLWKKGCYLYEVDLGSGKRIKKYII